MVLGAKKITSEYQYSLKVAIWQSDREGMTQCHKTTLRDLRSSEKKESLIRLVLVRFELCMTRCSDVQSAKSIADRQSAKTFSMVRGRGIRIHTSILQDSGCAVSCKKSHNQKGYIGRNQNALKHLIHKAYGDCCSRFENLKNILISHEKTP